MLRYQTLLMVMMCLLFSVNYASGPKATRLEKWLDLDPVLQGRMFRRLQEPLQKLPSEDQEDLMSGVWGNVRRDVCVKASPMFLAHIKKSERCQDDTFVRKQARQACKHAGIVPGTLLINNCTTALTRVCSKFFSFGGLPTLELCDAVGLSERILRDPAAVRAAGHSEL